jgi:hypothetical protein
MAPCQQCLEYDEDGEFLDTKFFRDILQADSGEGTGLADIPLDEERMQTTLPDGTKAIMADMCNTYHKKRTGKVAYEHVALS